MFCVDLLNWQNNFLYTTCSPHVLQKEELLTKIYLYQIFKLYFFVISFSYFVIRLLLNSFIVKSDNEIGKVDDKKKYDLKKQSRKILK